MTSPYDLTTLSAVKEVLGVKESNTTEDSLITRMITRLSQVSLAVIGRETLLSKVYTEIYDGTGTRMQLLRQYPVSSVSAVVMDGITLPFFKFPVATTFVPSVAFDTPLGGGWTVEAWSGIPPGRNQAVELVGGMFPMGSQNVQITYTAGYQATETYTVTGNFQFTPAGAQGILMQDVGVGYADTGAPLTAVAATPATGQYVAPTPQAVNEIGYYQFSATDVGSTVKVTYSYVPHGIEGALCEWVAERKMYFGRLSQRSKSLGGNETVSYNIADLPPFVKLALQPYKRVIWP